MASIQEFVPSLDIARFRQDGNYRQVICCQIVQNEDPRSITIAYQLADTFGMDKWELSMSHLKWFLSMNLPSAYARWGCAFSPIMMR